ncbi:RtcB family protein [Fluviicola sp.]|uniref:RtcB family protein n=1 Tax=Fluviicola sp. TaxID=1917219 RepID=UPI0031DFBD92
MGNKLKGKDLLKIGFPNDNSVNIALGLISRYKKKESKERVLAELSELLHFPDEYIGDGIWGKVAEGLVAPVEVKFNELKIERSPFLIYGENEIDEQTKHQFYQSLKLPVSVQGALMPDAHYGYGLPIGGVLATKNAVIPYGVGVDIGCRMSMTIFDAPASFFNGRTHQLENLLSDHTKFGMYETHKVRHDHPVLESTLFREIPLLKKLHGKAYQQLGTSGGGNHFVEFGVVTITANDAGIPQGEYLGLLSHSGSRGLGAAVAKHYTQAAIKQCPLPKQVQHLAWLDLNTHDGQEYWKVMNLAGEYAKACHDDIHARLTKKLGLRMLMTIENHHNFAWKETVNGEECIVHRKGATPAGLGQLGIIPGSMTAPGFIVRGLGNESSLNSASHGAGRQYSRSQCKGRFTKSEMMKELGDSGVSLIGGAVDECPQAYKNIHHVMGNQQELVETIGTFTPKIVRMDKR